MDTVVAGMVSGVANSVGQQSDAASATGSVNAKIADVKNAITNKNNPVDWSVKTPHGGSTWLNTLAATTSSTVLNISGSGYLNSFSFTGNQLQLGMGVYLDGTKIIDETVNANGISPSGNMIAGPLRFKSSLQLVVRNNSGSAAVIGSAWAYNLD